MSQFQLLKGSYHQDGRRYNWKDNENNVVESEIDLEVEYPGKFKEVKEVKGMKSPTPPTRRKLTSPKESDLDDMSVIELRDHANEKGIDLEGATKKEEIIEAIRKNQ